MVCAICRTRRPRRFCPGVAGEICTFCCGVGREVTIHCPLDCEYLRDARKHDKPAALDHSGVPNQDIRVTEKFLADQEEFLAFLGQALSTAAREIPGAVDFDVRQALDGLIRTYRTLQSGVYYESLPTNPLAAAIYRAIQDAVARFRSGETERLGMSRTRDADALGLLVFLQRLEFDRNNGRPKGRAFLDVLRGFYAAGAAAASPPAPSLILP